MKTFKLLDLFCGAGGAGEGYRRAGFEVVGVDVNPQPRYKAGRFVQADALAYVAQYGWMFDAIHASPPCQAHSLITPDKSKHVDLIPQTRFWLETIGAPYVIENVYGARRTLRNPVMLCGRDFGLKVYRHRLFESNVLLMGLHHEPHRDNTPRAGHGISDKGFISVTSGGKSSRRSNGLQSLSSEGFVTMTGHFSGIEYCRTAMGIEWMTAKELSQAIPPAFTEFLGRQIMTHLQNKAVAA